MKVDQLLIHSRNAVEAEKEGVHAMWCSELSISPATLKSLYQENDIDLHAELYEVNDEYTIVTFELGEFHYSARIKTSEYYEMMAQKKLAL